MRNDNAGVLVATAIATTHQRLNIATLTQATSTAILQVIGIGGVSLQAFANSNYYTKLLFHYAAESVQTELATRHEAQLTVLLVTRLRSVNT